MKNRYFGLLTTFVTLLFHLNAKCEIIADSIPMSYYDAITNRTYTIVCYEITNNSSEDYYTWISLDTIDNKTKKDILHDFFKKRKGHFSYIDLMFEELATPLSISIGYTFITKISPGCKFHYIFVQSNGVDSIYSNRIVVMPKAEVESYVRFEIDEKYFYKCAYIVLNDF